MKPITALRETLDHLDRGYSLLRFPRALQLLLRLMEGFEGANLTELQALSEGVQTHGGIQRALHVLVLAKLVERRPHADRRCSAYYLTRHGRDVAAHIVHTLGRITHEDRATEARRGSRQREGRRAPVGRNAGSHPQA